MKTKLKQFIKSILGIIVLIILYAVYLPFGLIRSLVDREWITNFVEDAGDLAVKLRKAMFGKIKK